MPYCVFCRYTGLINRNARFLLMSNATQFKPPDSSQDRHFWRVRCCWFELRRMVPPLLLLLGGMVSLSTQVCAQTTPAQKVQPQLNLKALAEPLQDLTADERSVVDKAVELIKEMKDGEALTDLTSLTQSNPKNSALRVLRAYVLLELGNVTGALDDAKVAEGSGVHTAYRCWFLAQVAYLAGNKPLCHREIKHLGNNPTYGPQAAELGRVLDGGTK